MFFLRHSVYVAHITCVTWLWGYAGKNCMLILRHIWWLDVQFIYGHLQFKSFSWVIPHDPQYGYEWMNEWKCGDLKCVQKPTRGRLSPTHLPYSRWAWSESPCNQSGRKWKGLWRKGFAEEPSLEFGMKFWASKRWCKGDSGEGEDDELPCVIERAGDCVWRRIEDRGQQGEEHGTGGPWHLNPAWPCYFPVVKLREDKICSKWSATRERQIIDN